MEPIDLLKKELDKYKRALQKSKDSFAKGQIDPYTHQEHRENLMPKIQSYTNAVRTLQRYL